MTTYFMNCKNLDELKKAYKAAAMKYHPDMGGDTATMQAINAEYEARFEVLKRSQNEQAAEDATGQTKATTDRHCLRAAEIGRTGDRALRPVAVDWRRDPEA